MSSRNYENENDFQKMRAFLIDARRDTGHYAGYWHIGAGLTWCTFLMSFHVDLGANIHLWEDRAGALLGFAIFGDDFSMRVQVRPNARGQGIEEEMFAWIETRLMRMSEYARDLDVVAVAPDDTIAAYAMGWVDRANKVGEFEPVGTRPTFQRKGLARAALLEGMSRMKARGVETALVSTNGSKASAIRLYESAGFCVVNQELNFTRSKQ